MLTRTAIAEATLAEEESRGLYRLAAQIQADVYTDDPADYDTLCSPAACHAYPDGCGP